jgi:phosphopantothenoylcysteine decarboxylase/phosphopantothenate--cysteine ligase
MSSHCRPTYEAIDPVRFIGNRSSGKMGIAIADDLTKRGAEVVLILGPSSEKIPTQIAKVVRIESADDMYHAVMSEIKDRSARNILCCSGRLQAKGDGSGKNKKGR